MEKFILSISEKYRRVILYTCSSFNFSWNRDVLSSIFRSFAWFYFLASVHEAFNPVKVKSFELEFCLSYLCWAKYNGFLLCNIFFSMVLSASEGRCFNICSEYWYTYQGKNVGGISLSLPYFVILISFIQWAKKLLTVVMFESMSASLFVFFFIFMGKQICILLGFT